MAICFPGAIGVPFAGGPPVWWNDVDGSLPALNRRHDDPRWRGCTRIGLGASGASEDPSFRALHAVDGAGKTWLHLSWTVKATNSTDPAMNRVLVGFRRAGGPSVMLRAVPFPLHQPQDAPGVHRLASARQFTPADAAASTAPPSWMIGFGRVFSSGADFWAVHLRVPITHAGGDIDEDGINLGAAGANFKFGFEVKVTLNGGGPVDSYGFPRAGFEPGAPDTWEDAAIGGANCGNVVSIDASQIRSDPPPAHTINFTKSGPPGMPNELIASPLNSTGQQIAANAIEARFSIANWGSQPDPHQVADPSTLWKAIPGPIASNASPIANGSSGEIKLGWTVDEPFLSEFRTPPGDPPPKPLRWAHQCMLVELSGAGIDFSPSSAVRNMDFVGASTFTRDAEISVRGLADPGTPQHDVYLLVKTTNMPQRVERPRPEPDAGPGIRRDRARAAGKGRGRDGDGDGDGEYDPYATDLGGFDLIARDHPTYVVYAFHDTGAIDGESGLPRLAPQVPFGYVVDHDGELHGWEHELSGANLTLVGPDLYRLRVPTGGVAVVTTRIEALERPVRWWERLLRWLLAHLRELCRRLWRGLRDRARTRA